MKSSLPTPSRVTSKVLGSPIDVVNWDQAVRRLAAWAEERTSRYVCISNVHSVVSATQDASFARALAAADMTTPDGAPVAWLMRRQGHAAQTRINGPDLMWRYFEAAEVSGQAVYLVGSTPTTLNLLTEQIAASFPKLKIAGAESPPFRPLTKDEDAELVARINNSGAGTVWVSLGCPKQELWMAAHRGQIHAVMLGVGAAFDYHAGTVSRAPAWMQRNGLEWLHRLCSEPRRLWRRYLTTNSLFIWAVIKQLIRRRFGAVSREDVDAQNTATRQA